MSKKPAVRTDNLSVHQKVVFLGFADPENLPDQHKLLIPGEVYEVVKIVPETAESEGNCEIAVDNPNYDPKKKPSKRNQKQITFTAFGDEISLDGVPDLSGNIDFVDEEEAEDDDIPAPKKTVSQKRSPAKKVASKPVVATKKADATKKRSTKKIATKSKVEDKAASTKKPATKKTVSKTKTKQSSGPSPEKVKRSLKKDRSGEAFDEDRILILTDDEEDADILALVSETDDIIALAQDEIHDASMTEFRLGGVLYHVKKAKTYKEFDNGKYAGKGGWSQFVLDVLGMEYRKAMYLIDIYTKFSKYGIPAEEAARIGWTKAAVIAAPMDGSNSQKLLDYATDQTVSELKETVKEIRKTGTREVIRRTTFKFRLLEDAGFAVREILELAKSASPERGEDEIFEQIVTEWASEHLEIASVQKAQRRAKKKAREARTES